MDRAQRAVAVGRQADPLPGLRAMTEAEGLLPRQHQLDRAPELERGHHRKDQLVLGPQPGAEGAADERVLHGDLVLRQAEHARHHPATVLRALRLVVDGQVAVGAPKHGRRVHFHRHMMFDTTAERGVHLDRC